MSDTRRFVIFPLGETRYALDSCQITELVMPTRVYSFPHTMASVLGVLVRRGSVIPVCKLRGAMGGNGVRRCYVIARCELGGRMETVALPVSGDCELVQGEPVPVDKPMTFVTGLLRAGGSMIPMLNLSQLVAHCIEPVATAVGEETR